MARSRGPRRWSVRLAAAVIDNEFYGSTGVGAETVPFYAYGAVNVAACVATGPTTTAAGSTTSTVPPSTSTPPEALVLSGVVVCDSSSGDSTVTWTMHNNTATAMRGTDLRYVFGVSGVDIPANDTVSVDEVITGPAEPDSVYNEVYGFSGTGSATQPFYASASVQLGACTTSTTTTAPATGRPLRCRDGTTQPEVSTTTTQPATTVTTQPEVSTTTLVPREALVLSGVAECSDSTGVTTLSWTVANNTADVISGTDLRLVFGVSGVEVAAGGSESGSRRWSVRSRRR